MKPLISVIFPTRRRVRKLERAVKSYLACCAPGALELRIRVQEDDPETLAWAKEQEPPVYCHEGGRVSGGILGPSHTDLLRLSTGMFIWMGNDDVVISGRQINPTIDLNFGAPAIYQPEFHQLGKSVYHQDANCPFFIVPRFVWERFNKETIEDPVDIHTLDFLRKAGWETKYLRGVHIWHDRDEADCHNIATS